MATSAEQKSIVGEWIVNETNVNTLIAATRDEDNLLATAMVNVVTQNGDKVLVRAVIDMGSQSAMINERAQQALGLKTERIHADEIRSNDVSVEISMQKITTTYKYTEPQIHGTAMRNVSIIQSSLPEYNTQAQIQHMDSRMHNGDQVSPLMKLGNEFYESRRNSVCTIYPIDELKKLKESVE